MKKKEKQIKKMPTIIEYGLIYIPRKVNWPKVIEEFGEEKANDIKRWRKELMQYEE